jgi:hypothetical protein
MHVKRQPQRNSEHGEYTRRVYQFLIATQISGRYLHQIKSLWAVRRVLRFAEVAFIKSYLPKETIHSIISCHKYKNIPATE